MSQQQPQEDRKRELVIEHFTVRVFRMEDGEGQSHFEVDVEVDNAAQWYNGTSLGDDLAGAASLYQRMRDACMDTMRLAIEEENQVEA
jgi:hypothetical protein